MSKQKHLEELAALAAGGLLSEQESVELREHTKNCPQCRKLEEEFSELVHSGLPLTVGRIREFVDRTRVRVNHGTRARFLEIARREGVVFSSEVQAAIPHRPRRINGVLAMVTAAVVLLVSVYGKAIYRRAVSQPGGVQSAQQIERLRQQNASLNETLSQLNQSFAAQQREIQNLRTQLGTATKTAESLRHENEQAGGMTQAASGQNAQFPVELANRDKQLEKAQAEIGRINQLRADDEASLTAQQVRIAELSDQLRIASATLDLERQLTAAGKDIRELLVARQLHVIDIRDTDANGKPSKAFGRIFVTEGKSLTFYAFDLNEDRVIDAKHRFEVWGSQQAKGGPAHNLGFLYVDDKSQRRWALKVNDPQLVKEVDSVFVTVEPPGGAPKPSGKTLLYAYFGQANHP
jgi:hypothetical protein